MRFFLAGFLMAPFLAFTLMALWHALGVDFDNAPPYGMALFAVGILASVAAGILVLAFLVEIKP